MPALDRRIAPRGAHFWREDGVLMFANQLDASTRDGPRPATDDDRAAHAAALAELAQDGARAEAREAQMSLLSVIQAVTGLLSLPTPAVVATSTDRQVIQLMAIANEEGKSLARRHAWQALTEEANFVTVNANVQTATPIPADFDCFVPNSFFNRTTRRPVTGPISPREWQWIMAQPVYSTVYLAFRERSGQFLVAPAPPAGQAVFYEYISENWAESAAGAPQSAYLADTDTAFLDESLIQLGVRWRFLKSKGLDYAEDMTTYERELEQAIARDGGSSMLSLAPQPVDLNRVNLPDGSFGV